MRSPRKLTTRAAGFSIIEVVVSMSVAIIGLMALTASVAAGSRMQQQTQRYGLAFRAIRQLREDLQNGDLDTRVAALKASPQLDAGQITVSVSFPEQILVDVLGSAPQVGWRYRDLDADGEVDLDAAATSDNSLVPVECVARWEGGELLSRFVITGR